MVSTRYQEPTFDSSIDAQNKSVRILKKKKGKKKRTFSSSFLESRGFLEFCFGPSVAQKAIERARGGGGGCRCRCRCCRCRYAEKIR